jgi:hypothetical protein
VTPAAFKRSLAKARPPAGLSPALTALWWAGKDDWTKAHEIAMGADTKDGAWVHAYLHRLEGDLDNARYWYRRAGRKLPGGPVASEWTEIAVALLSSTAPH